MIRFFILSFVICYYGQAHGQFDMVVHQKSGICSFPVDAVDSVTFVKTPLPISDYLTIGEDGDYASVVKGFAAAIAQDKGCIILPGTYNLVDEGATCGWGIIAPKHVIGYGAKLIANIPGEDWRYSAINVSTDMDEVIIEGIEIEVSNCRYCIHDEQYNREKFYHHVFKNCKLTHKSPQSDILIRPICIGGGFGNSCLVEIEKCDFFSMDEVRDVDYHANSNGQSGNCIVVCKDSFFKNSISITGNLKTGFVNTMFVYGCSLKELPQSTSIENSMLYQWRNVVR